MAFSALSAETLAAIFAAAKDVPGVDEAATAIAQLAETAGGGQHVAADSTNSSSVHAGNAIPPAVEGGQSASSHSARLLDSEGGQSAPSHCVRSFVPTSLSSDLLFLLQEHKVVDKNILPLEQNGIESISDFAGMEGSEEDLRVTLINQFDLAKDVKGKVQVSRLLQAFSDAKERVKARSKVKALATA